MKQNEGNGARRKSSHHKSSIKSKVNRSKRGREIRPKTDLEIEQQTQIAATQDREDEPNSMVKSNIRIWEGEMKLQNHNQFRPPSFAAQPNINGCFAIVKCKKNRNRTE